MRKITSCVIRKLVLKDDINHPMKFTRKSLIDTLRAKTEGKTSYQARKKPKYQSGGLMKYEKNI
ncbi:hypothetical protein COU54_04475 [Candidatus Pacearchaeota archaeon CG10_big_fil_rev_8_21_14_0_10_31_24]|nr:MAG: hypothetical protein COU54_04475 [Candidatus Pacearchaeota archaeon CG10_big_fil_rev_8_21_14_0_10_31_24]